MALLKPGDVRGDRADACFDPAMIAVGCGVNALGDEGFVVEKQADIAMQGWLIALERQHVIAALIDNLVCDCALAIECIRRDDRPLQRQQVQKFRNGRDLIGFAIHGKLAQHKPLIRRPSADKMKRRFLGCAVEGTPQRLAVYGDNSLDRLGEFPHEDKKAGVEFNRIEQAEHTAERVVARNAMPQTKKLPEERLLCAAE